MYRWYKRSLTSYSLDRSHFFCFDFYKFIFINLHESCNSHMLSILGWQMHLYKVHGLSRHCPWMLSGWSIGMTVHGQCPLSPWIMSTESMDIIHSVQGQFRGHCSLSPWTMSTESMDNVHSVLGLTFITFLGQS